MINIDLNKAFHPRLGEMLAPLVPGSFFIILVLLANPQWAGRLVALTGPNHYYSAVFVAVFLAFVAGNAAMLWVWLIQSWMIRAYQAIFTRLPKLRDWRLKRAQAAYQRQLQELQQHAQPPSAGIEQQQQQQPPTQQARPAASRTLDSRTRAYYKTFETRQLLEDVQAAWQLAGLALLKRYGVESPRAGEWWPWPSVLGRVRPSHRRGSVMMITMQATGWSGCAVVRFAPALRMGSYLAFCIFLIVVGTLHSYDVARNNADPILSWMGALRGVVDELKETAKNAEGSAPLSDSPTE